MEKIITILMRSFVVLVYIYSAILGFLGKLDSTQGALVALLALTYALPELLIDLIKIIENFVNKRKKDENNKKTE